MEPSITEALPQLLQRQQQAFLAQPDPELAQRLATLQALKRALLSTYPQLLSAMSRDFGHRSDYDSLLADVLPVLNYLKYCQRNLRRWMRPQRRHSGLLLAPSNIKVHYQPKGVCGIIVPWNFPVMLSLSPLISALAAGNRVMLKLSEFTPQTNQILRQLLAQAFDETQVAVIEGDAKIAAAFAALPFDHLLFTGATSIGKSVMQAAANNLTPVTLELGGKSPAIIADDMPLAVAVERLLYGKTLNAGQTCVAPDYILCPQHKVAEFVRQWQTAFQQMYPDFAHNTDYSFIINDRHQQRLLGLLDDATAKGATGVPASGDLENFKQQRQWPTILLTGVTDDMSVMQQEIFGPLLPIIGYQTVEQALDYIRQRPRPLALYLLTFDPQLQQQLLQQTHSGGVCINDSLYHVAADDAPFGGVGSSGMGHYHGVEGFREFSHARTVLAKGRLNPAKLMQPPYRRWWQKLLLRYLLR
ncbi:coniferyl aldehyde dehydrogenase [Shewanella dokdonensis]|nr:coniferyl aldehyde dehydrogenase [Shewanella dokdonensis]MCL1074389.1 coniferyl aldehyde dehydrogenase [Shewanella dokdonensis]